MPFGRRVSTATAALTLGLVAGWLALVAGSDEVIVCGSGTALDRVAEDVNRGLGAGHIDGATATSCTVPSDGAWIGALGALAVVVALTIAVSVRLARRSPPTHGAAA